MKVKIKKLKQNKSVKKGETVFVIAGNYKGQTGSVLSRTHDKAIVQGINVRKKAVKKSEANPRGGFVDLERPLHISNLKVAKGK